MRIKDIFIIIVMIGVMSFILVSTGLVLPFYTYTEDGNTYTVDKESQFATYNDDAYDVTFGFYMNHEDLLFYREEDENEWKVYDEATFYYEIVEPESRLNKVKPPDDGKKHIDQVYGEYYYVQSLEFVYLKDDKSYIGYFESDEDQWYLYNKVADAWYLITE